ncbi:MAG: hypothetical protein SFW07_07560 [Gammaproteobacteria bacterium]|nr:hypothetical protein [Gammaproteobacteria bacterium]
MTIVPIKLSNDNPRDFYMKYVLRSYKAYQQARNENNEEDIFYCGTIASLMAHSMADHIKNHFEIAIKNPSHMLPNTNIIRIAVTQNYISDLKNYWPAFKLNSLIAESLKHRKCMKLEKRKEWLQGGFDPEVSLGSVCIAVGGKGLYDLILPENQNVSEALSELVHGWEFILKQI